MSSVGIPMTDNKKRMEGLYRGTYLQHPVRQIHQLPLVLDNLGYCGRLILLEFTDVI